MTNEELVVFEKVLDELRHQARAMQEPPALNVIKLSDIPLPPEKPRHDWNNAVNRHCDYCGRWELTVMDEEHSANCADCATEGRLNDWQEHAKELRAMLVTLAGGKP